jgi:hypothetical protein
MRTFLIGLSLVAAVTAGAVTIAPGYVAVVPHVFFSGIPEPPPPPPMYLLDNAAVYKGALPGYWPLVAFGTNNHVFVIGWFDNVIYEYDIQPGANDPASPWPGGSRWIRDRAK